VAITANSRIDRAGDYTQTGGKTFEIIYLSDTERLTTAAAQVVPVSAAVWLFASALAGLFAVGRRRAAG
jgi:hypothetical protein